MNEPRFENLKVRDLIATADNPRIVNTASDAFEKLLASVKADGVKVPVVCRQHPAIKNKYDLRAGARRLEAARMAKLKTIPALVYEEMSDQEAFDITFLENFAREDLLPLEEAKAVAVLLEKYGGDYKAVAAKFGKSERWVHLRANIETGLIREWKQAIEETAGVNLKAIESDEWPDFAAWGVGHFALIARYDPQVQLHLLELMKESYLATNCTVADLESRLLEQSMELKLARWNLDLSMADEATGEEFCACLNCRRRTITRPMLWVEPGQDIVDRCTDRKCWQKKHAIYLRGQITAAREKIGDKLVLLDNGLYPKLRGDLQNDLNMKIEQPYNLLSAKKSDHGAFPCLMIGGKGEGQITWRKNAHTGKTASTKTAGAKKTLADKRAELERKRWFDVLKDMCGCVEASDPTRIDKGGISTIQKIASIIVCFGCETPYGEKISDLEEIFNNFDADRVYGRLWELTVPRIIGQIIYHGPVTQVPQQYIDNAKYFAGLLLIDIDNLYADACEKHPEPKSWKKEKEEPLAEDAEPDDDLPEEEVEPAAKRGRGRPKRKERKH